ncbi:MAG: HAMP domain-containing histidine kinase [Dehalococcoidia bacterium]|nr:MAG: HAMP domain-containing histidine kinase [Dehalococcoidia bacterium]
MKNYYKEQNYIHKIIGYRGAILTGIGLSLFYWIFESLVTSITFEESSFITQLITPDTHEVWMRILGMSVIMVFSIIVQNVLNRHKKTENKLLELSNNLEDIVEKRTKELEYLNKQLQQQIDQRILFTRTMVHELKTPLTPMLGTSEMLLSKTKDNKILSRLAININRGAHNLNRRISDLTDLAKGEIGILNIEYKPFNFLEMIEEVVDYVNIIAERNNQTIIVKKPPTFPTVWADEDRIRQVIINLLDNAIKYNPNNSQINLDLDAGRNVLSVHVSDNGTGIEIDDQKRLFDLYFVSSNNKEGLRGLGIGLPLAKMIVEAHGGQIWFESKIGVGSKFSFSIPLILPILSSPNN